MVNETNTGSLDVTDKHIVEQQCSYILFCFKLMS